MTCSYTNLQLDEKPYGTDATFTNYANNVLLVTTATGPRALLSHFSLFWSAEDYIFQREEGRTKRKEGWEKGKKEGERHSC